MHWHRIQFNSTGYKRDRIIQLLLWKRNMSTCLELKESAKTEVKARKAKKGKEGCLCRQQAEKELEETTDGI